ncbi:MAG: hypothetical protein H5U06_02660 [Candidatus Aminicenantes bacterium]|nr:hypothetical protein [Candidatus Aminicenantes bacterium]
MLSPSIRAKRTGCRVPAVLLFILLVAFSGQVLLAQSSSESKTTWELGLTADLFNRGIKWDDKSSTLKSLNLLLEARAKNLGGFFDLNVFAGLGNTNLNGITFGHLPITLDYEGGSISGIIFGLGIDKTFFTTSSFNFGLMADFASYIGFKKTFVLEGFIYPGEAQTEPDWAQASGGIFVLYDGLEKVQPFLQIAASKLWGTFKMTEKIEDLTGDETKDLKDAGLLSITLGWNISLSEKICLIPRARVYLGSKTALGGGISFFYAF